MLRIAAKIWCLFLLLGLGACAAQRPVLYPNERWRQAGARVAGHDIDDCMQQAEAHLGSEGRAATVAGSAAKGGGTGAAVGAAGGAVGGAVVGSAGRGAAVGAAGGGAVGFVRGLFRGLFKSREPSPLYKNFVNRCLRDKGYEPIGWK